jgi:hypothetical protein
MRSRSNGSMTHGHRQATTARHRRESASPREHFRPGVRLSICTFDIWIESSRHGAAGEAIVAQLLNQEAVLHVRVDGKSVDIPLADLDIGAASEDREIKRALARHLEIPEAKLRDYTVDRHETGNLTVRPEAVFG